MTQLIYSGSIVYTVTYLISYACKPSLSLPEFVCMSFTAKCNPAAFKRVSYLLKYFFNLQKAYLSIFIAVCTHQQWEPDDIAIKSYELVPIRRNVLSAYI